MSIANAQQICDNAVARTALDICIHDLRLYPQLLRWIRKCALQIWQHSRRRLFPLLDSGQTHARHKLHDSGKGACSENSVRRKFEIEVFLPKKPIHQDDDLNHELILSEIVTRLEDDGVMFILIRFKMKEHREER